jgi:hypothetical protein
LINLLFEEHQEVTLQLIQQYLPQLEKFLLKLPKLKLDDIDLEDLVLILKLEDVKNVNEIE